MSSRSTVASAVMELRRRVGSLSSQEWTRFVRAATTASRGVMLEAEVGLKVAFLVCAGETLRLERGLLDERHCETTLVLWLSPYVLAGFRSASERVGEQAR